MTFKQAAANGLVVLISSMLMLVALEAATRAYSALQFPMMRIPDDRLGWRHAADREKYFTNEHGQRNLVVQNSNGHRGTYFPKDRTPGKFRILVLGDSFTEAVQVSEAELFTTRLEVSNAGWEVLNAGVGSYGTVQQYLYLVSDGLQFNPDLILLMFYHNDLFENCLPYSPGIGPRPYARVDEGGATRIVPELDYERYAKFALQLPFWSELIEHSYFYIFLNSRVYQPLLAAKMKTRALADRSQMQGCSEYSILFNLLERMAGQASGQGAEFIVALIPTAGEARKSRSTAHERILNFCSATGLRCLSLIDALQARRHSRGDSSGESYFDADIHWTDAGHARVAEQIGAYIHIGHAPQVRPTAPVER